MVRGCTLVWVLLLAPVTSGAAAGQPSGAPGDGAGAHAPEVPQPDQDQPPAGDRRVLAALVAADPSLQPALVAELEHQLKAAIMGRSGHGLLDLRRALAPDVGHDVRKTVRNAEAAFAAGKQAYENLEAQQAIDHLRRACDDFEAGYSEVHEAEPMVDAHVFLGSVLLQTGNQREALEHLRSALFLDPGLELDANLFPPADIEALERVRRDIARAPRGKAEIESAPVSARVHIDGIYRGTTPIIVSNLPPGDHFGLTERDGYEPIAGIIDVKPQRTRYFEQNLISVRRLSELQRVLSAVDPGRSDLGGAAPKLRELLPGDGAILVTTRMRDDGAGLDTRVHYIDHALGRRVRLVEDRLPVGGPRLGPALRDLVDRALDPSQGVEPVDADVADAGGPPLELDLDLPWGTILIGTGAVVGVAAAAAGIAWMVTNYEAPAEPLTGGRRLSVLGF